MQLKGWFGKLLKGAIKAIAVTIASAIHPALGLALGTTINNTINNWLDGDFWQIRQSQPQVSLNANIQPVTYTIKDPAELELYSWLKTKITDHWINNFFSSIKSEQEDYLSDTFREKINKIILRLEVLRLYYKGLSNVSFATKSFDINVDQILDNADIKGKSDLFLIIQNAIRQSYENALTEAGKTVFVKQVNAFKANKYSIGNYTPEPINFNFSAQSNIDVYVFNQSQNVTINYTDSTSTSTLNQQAVLPNTPNSNEVVNQLETATTATTINQTVKTAGLWIGGLIAGGWLWSKIFNYKPQNK